MRDNEVRGELLLRVQQQHDTYKRLAELHDATADEYGKLAVLMDDSSGAMLKNERFNRQAAEECRRIVNTLAEPLRAVAGMN